MIKTSDWHAVQLAQIASAGHSVMLTIYVTIHSYHVITIIQKFPRSGLIGWLVARSVTEQKDRHLIMQRLNKRTTMEQYSVCKQGVKMLHCRPSDHGVKQGWLEGTSITGPVKQVTLGGRRHDVRLTSDLRFSMTVHPPYFWAVCRANSPPDVEKKEWKRYRYRRVLL